MPALKLERFDKKLLSILEQRGETPADEISKEFKINPEELQKRLKTLMREKYLSLTASNSLVLGLKGFNALEAKAKRAKKAKPVPSSVAVEEKTPREHSGSIAAEKKEEITELDRKIFEIPETAGNPQQTKLPLKCAVPSKKPVTAGAKEPANKEEFEQISSQVEEQGIMLVSKGALTPSLSQTPAAASLPSTAPNLQQGLSGNNAKGEVCELCKAPFKLSVKREENQPLYGHCFCGAAYHQDCYESLVESGRCVRCGKKLELRLNRASQETTKQIKNLFD